MRLLGGKWRWLVYVVVGVSLVVAVYTFSMSHPRWKPTPIEKNLTSALLGTIVLIGYVLQWGWRYRRFPKFWLAFTALALLHCAVFLLLSLWLDHWPVLMLGSTIGGEAVVMAVVLRWAVEGIRV
jgi:uncharacterized membrane protein AbrB (regulator of aidB expression)